MHLRPMTRESERRIWATMDVVAEITGGRAFRNTNELTAGVRAAATDMRGSYSVGFYVPDNSDNRWREFEVRVKRPGVNILHRRGYMALAPVKQPVNWAQTDWQAAMQNPLGSTAIRLDGRADRVRSVMQVVLQIAATTFTTTGQRRAGGRSRDRIRRAEPQGMDASTARRRRDYNQGESQSGGKAVAGAVSEDVVD